MISKLAIAGYRSIRDLRLELGQVNVVTGANGSGKSSLYRALRLLADVAQSCIVQSLALEGGLSSTLWAGPETISRSMIRGDVPVEGTRRKSPISLRLGFGSAEYGYAIDIGLPHPAESLFARDPVIKSESLWTGETLGRANEIASRRGPSARVKSETGDWRQAVTALAPHDSMMTHAADTRDGFELQLLRERMRGWRFYDQLRTDRDAPARRPQVGTFTPVLASDGSDLAAALQTIHEIGDGRALTESIDDAFPGTRLGIESHDGYFDVTVQQKGLLRALRTAELSDGTLRYLLLVAALLSPRPPQLMILNEPETSLHSDLLAPLARLIAMAAHRAQLVVVTHSTALAEGIAGEISTTRIALEKQLGQTVAVDMDVPSWTWLSR